MRTLGRIRTGKIRVLSAAHIPGLLQGRTPDAIRTHTVPGLSRPPLPIGVREQKQAAGIEPVSQPWQGRVLTVVLCLRVARIGIEPITFRV